MVRLALQILKTPRDSADTIPKTWPLIFTFCSRIVKNVKKWHRILFYSVKYIGKDLKFLRNEAYFTQMPSVGNYSGFKWKIFKSTEFKFKVVLMGDSERFFTDINGLVWAPRKTLKPERLYLWLGRALVGVGNVLMVKLRRLVNPALFFSVKTR